MALTSNAKPEPAWIERIAAGQAPRLRNPHESVEDYRVAMGWDKPPAPDLLAAAVAAVEVMERAKKLLRAAGLCMEGGTISGPYNDALDRLRAAIDAHGVAPASTASAGGVSNE